MDICPVRNAYVIEGSNFFILMMYLFLIMKCLAVELVFDKPGIVYPILYFDSIFHHG
jgi:hypothetical protein